MKPPNEVYRNTIKNLHQWGYVSGDVMSTIDVQIASWQASRSIAMFDSYIVCMCLIGTISDFGDGFFLLNEAQ